MNTWIVRSADGWCALPPGVEPDPEAWNDPTLCGFVVLMRWGSGKGEPDCPMCLAKLRMARHVTAAGFLVGG